MALESKANIKTQAAAIATALNTALGDTLLTGLAVEVSHPSHPLRNWQKFVKLSTAGVFSADDDYIDSAYDGDNTSWPRQGNEFITPDPV